jgi:hypothetical protein
VENAAAGPTDSPSCTIRSRRTVAPLRQISPAGAVLPFALCGFAS